MKIFIMIVLLSANILAQGINWGLRFDAIAVNTTSNFATHTTEMETKMHYPPFFTTPQLIVSVNPIKQAGIEFRAGYEFASSDFSGGEYSLYGKYHLYPFLYLMGGVCLKQLATFYPSDRFSNRIGTTFGMSAAGIGWNVGKHISLELEYLHTNKRLIEYSDYDFYNESNQNLRRERYLNYVIKLSAGFNWSIYDF
jgi:hypothetical protein